MDTIGRASSKQADTIAHLRVLSRQFLDPTLNPPTGLSLLNAGQPITPDDVHELIERAGGDDLQPYIDEFNSTWQDEDVLMDDQSDDKDLNNEWSNVPENDVRIFPVLTDALGDNEHHQGSFGNQQGGIGTFNCTATPNPFECQLS